MPSRDISFSVEGLLDVSNQVLLTRSGENEKIATSTRTRLRGSATASALQWPSVRRQCSSSPMRASRLSTDLRSPISRAT